MAFTTITDGLDWQDKNFLEELFAGFNARMPRDWVLSSGYANCSEVDVPAAGDDIQAAAVWSTLQSRIEDQYNNYTLYHHGGGTMQIRWLVPYDMEESGSGYFDDFPTVRGFIGFCEETAAMAYIDAATCGWRRATVWPDDWQDLEDEAYSYGQMQAGDIIGPWVFKDLQTALSGMVKRYYTGTTPKGKRRLDSSVSTWSDYAEAVDAWLDATPTNIVGFPAVIHSKSGFVNRHSLRRDSVRFGLYVNGTIDDYNLADPESIARGATGSESVLYYVRTAAPFGINSDKYDANGDGGIEGKLAKLKTGTLGALSGFVGNINTAPVECTDAVVSSADVSKGYIRMNTANFSMHIVEFNFD